MIDEEGGDPIEERPTARVLLLDRTCRVFLLASRDDNGRLFWYTPGGGAEAGESAEATARRELREETGITDAQLGAEIWRRCALVERDGVRYNFRECWFLAKVAQPAISTTGFTLEECGSIIDHRWWTVEELSRSEDRLVPGELAMLVLKLLHDGVPLHPIMIDS